MPEYDMKFKDFSLGDPDAPGNELGLGVPIEFKVGKDVFRAPAVVAPILLGRITAAAQGFSEPDGDMGKKLEYAAEIFDQLLTPETAPRFRERLLSATEPIDLNRQAVPILYWLMEVYGMRPTQPSLSSMDGVSDGGPGSTDGVPNTAFHLSGLAPQDS